MKNLKLGIRKGSLLHDGRRNCVMSRDGLLSVSDKQINPIKTQTNTINIKVETDYYPCQTKYPNQCTQRLLSVSNKIIQSMYRKIIRVHKVGQLIVS